MTLIFLGRYISKQVIQANSVMGQLRGLAIIWQKKLLLQEFKAQLVNKIIMEMEIDRTLVLACDRSNANFNYAMRLNL